MALLDAVVVRLAALRLTIHPGAHPRPSQEGIPFLGFIVFPDRRRLKRRKGIHFRRHLAGLVREHAAGIRSLADISSSVRGWINHVRFPNTIGLRRSLFARVVIRSSSGSRRLATRSTQRGHEHE